MKKLLILSIFALLGLTSCKKQLTEKQNGPTKNSVTKFSELKTSETFDWKTTNEITFKYVGIPTIEPVKSKLTVTSEDVKIIFYAGNQEMAKSYEMKLAVPTNMKSLIVKYGAVRKTFSTSLSIISFDILPTIVE